MQFKLLGLNITAIFGNALFNPILMHCLIQLVENMKFNELHIVIVAPS